MVWHFLSFLPLSFFILFLKLQCTCLILLQLKWKPFDSNVCLQSSSLELTSFDFSIKIISSTKEYAFVDNLLYSPGNVGNTITSTWKMLRKWFIWETKWVHSFLLHLPLLQDPSNCVIDHRWHIPLHFSGKLFQNHVLKQFYLKLFFLRTSLYKVIFVIHFNFSEYITILSSHLNMKFT